MFERLANSSQESLRNARESLGYASGREVCPPRGRVFRPV